ncbi:hypothetical protein BC831DRAFT_408822 [Entophlyctis helioformis]|nr:hypothetical protein BC831DRAFT_408822 [Entophlyctis helioformis]
MPSFKDIKTKVKAGVKAGVQKAQATVKTKWDYEKTLSKVKDRKNFEIDKQGRFAARGFQIALSLVSYYWLGVQNSEFMTMHAVGQVQSAMIFFAVVSPVISAFLIIVYVTPWFSHAWTSRRILSVETFCDLFMTLGWISGFMAELIAVQGACSLGWHPGCTNFNWLMAWLFFLFLSWGAGFFFDCTAWWRGVFSGDEIESDVLMDVRRTTRASRY